MTILHPDLYGRAVAFIALNDEPEEPDPAIIAEQLTVQTTSETFGIPAAKVAQDVLRYRRAR